ncbi:MAG TPA: sensor domain-containing diguanylate cyclase [Gemmatimonadaceae bacterium]|nr:sensor domain-containing diguanylate cyclase [Gemmatimonadaceae bacterium]
MPSRIGALALSVALTILATSAARSPIAALLACLIAALAWRAGGLYAIGVAIASLPVLVHFDPFLNALSSGARWERLALLFAAGTAAGLIARHATRPSEAEPWGDAAPGLPLASRTPSVERLMRDHALGRAVERDVIERLLTDAQQSLGADDVTLWLRVDEGAARPLLTMPPTAQRERRTDPPAHTLVSWCVEQGIVTTNQDTDAARLIVAPVGAAYDDRPGGALTLYAADRQRLSPTVRQELAAHAARLGALMGLLRDGRETRQYRGKAELLARAAERVQSSHDVAGLGHAICDAALEVTGATRAAFVVWDQREDAGTVTSVSMGHAVPEGFDVAPSSFVGTSCRERQRFTLSEVDSSSRYSVFGEGEPWRRLGSLAVAPLHRDSRSLGAIAVEGDEAGQLTAVESSLLLLLSSVSSAALVNVRSLERATVESRTDPLTRLANRRVFDERLRQHLAECDRTGQSLSLILADLDHFKQINDTYGHTAGDKVLAAVAAGAKRAIRNIDLCTRYGGEELAILLPQTPMERAREVAERLRRTFEAARLEVDGHLIAVTASFGVASFPTSTGRHDSLFSSADKALYEAKRAGRNCVKCAAENNMVTRS